MKLFTGEPFMMRRTAFAAILTLAFFASPAAAQGRAPADRPARPGIQARLGGLRPRIAQGVRRGQITPGELAKLRSDAQALRSKAQALRQAGTPPTAQQRQELRQDLQRLTREIAAARRNNIRRNGRG
jgi:hypothetical protein